MKKQKLSPFVHLDMSSNDLRAEHWHMVFTIQEIEWNFPNWNLHGQQHKTRWNLLEIFNVQIITDISFLSYFMAVQQLIFDLFEFFRIQKALSQLQNFLVSHLTGVRWDFMAPRNLFYQFVQKLSVIVYVKEFDVGLHLKLTIVFWMQFFLPSENCTNWVVSLQLLVWN